MLATCLSILLTSCQNVNNVKVNKPIPQHLLNVPKQPEKPKIPKNAESAEDKKKQELLLGQYLIDLWNHDMALMDQLEALITILKSTQEGAK